MPDTVNPSPRCNLISFQQQSREDRARSNQNKKGRERRPTEIILYQVLRRAYRKIASNGDGQTEVNNSRWYRRRRALASQDNDGPLDGIALTTTTKSNEPESNRISARGHREEDGREILIQISGGRNAAAAARPVHSLWPRSRKSLRKSEVSELVDVSTRGLFRFERPFRSAHPDVRRC